ncbi:DUF1989 domain-containing protein [Micrococcaceae bacterium Sec5.1]
MRNSVSLTSETKQETLTTIPSGGHARLRVAFRETLVLTDEDGGQTAQIIPVVAGDHRDRFSSANTMAINKTAFFTNGHIFYSYFCQQMMTIVGDDTGRHSLLPSPLGSLGSPSYTGGQHSQGLLAEVAASLETEPQLMPFPFQAFVQHDLSADGKVSAPRSGSEKGHTLALRADMDLDVAIVNNPFLLAGSPDDRIISARILSTKREV